MKFTTRFCAVALAASLLVPAAASAHKAFLLPSQTVLSGGHVNWITVDAAMSNDLFYFNHHALDLKSLVITGPDGAGVPVLDPHTGKWRSSFDVKLEKEGTYRLAIASSGVLAARYTVDGKRHRWFGTPAEWKQAIPKNARDLKVSQTSRRLETFVTVGAPTGKALEPTGKGLELVPITHPNDLYAREKASFQLLLDGKPASKVEVTVMRGGTRYRLSPEAIKVSTDEDGRFSVVWPKPGMYWLNAHVSGHATMAMADQRRASYTATLEVLPQ